ncbi:hypothetical protein EV194_10928 [Natronoflexus pectinivorans]|uniref:Uncharacterized protein n=1 Tax=Natronoflexus pectinivorans TaxID=682526 RepID=A0A4V6NMP6_9BACT|nr:hypothetical protein EV194_10928 [Natronoflexus pectinivorans]
MLLSEFEKIILQSRDCKMTKKMKYLFIVLFHGREVPQLIIPQLIFARANLVNWRLSI